MLAKIEKVLLFLTILFLPTQLGRHFWPQFSFVYSLPIDYLSPTLYFWDILVTLLWIVFLISKRHINRVALSFLYFFILTQALSLLAAGANIGIGLIRLEQYLMAGFFGVYIASQNLKEVKPIIFWGLAISIIGESLLAFGQFIKSGTLGFWIFGERSFTLSTPGIAKFDFYGSEFLRPYGTFPHPNVLAGFMVVTILLLSFLRKQEPMLYGSRSVGRPIKYGMSRVVMILSMITVLLTVSRTAIIVGLTSFLTLAKNKNRVLILLVVIMLLPVLFPRFSSLVNFDSLTLIRREELSKTALTLWKENPLLGQGLNNFIPAGADFLLAGPSRFLQPAHNIFLLTLAETGILGFLGFLGLISYHIFKLFHLPTTIYQLRTLLLAWVAILFLGLFDHYFITLPQGIRLLFLVWGISFCMLEWMNAKSS